jgi:hypothetical protein
VPEVPFGGAGLPLTTGKGSLCGGPVTAGNGPLAGDPLTAGNGPLAGPTATAGNAPLLGGVVGIGPLCGVVGRGPLVSWPPTVGSGPLAGLEGGAPPPGAADSEAPFGLAAGYPPLAEPGPPAAFSAARLRARLPVTVPSPCAASSSATVR